MAPAREFGDDRRGRVWPAPAVQQIGRNLLGVSLPAESQVASVNVL
ncbi:MAG: hypothetical protein QM681_08845 [Novosphingobium sp.]